MIPRKPVIKENVASQPVRYVTNFEGKEVDSSSEEWRAETEARSILRMKPAEREQMLTGIEKARKLAGRQKVEAEMQRLHTIRNKKLLSNDNT